MPQIFVDQDDVLYIRNADEAPQSPYWKTIMGLAICVESILCAEPDEDGLTDPRFFAMFGYWESDTPNEDEELLALQIPMPVSKDGTVVEEVIHHLRSFISDDEITDLIEHILETVDVVENLEPGESYTPFTDITPEDIIGKN